MGAADLGPLRCVGCGAVFRPGEHGRRHPESAVLAHIDADHHGVGRYEMVLESEE